MSWPKPVTLYSKTVQLEPLSIDHVTELIDAVQDGKLYNHWYTSIPQPKNMKMEIERRLKLQDMGTKRVEIGSTWYAKSVQRTSLNTECKLVLLEHAFEKLNCICVEFRTHFMNHQSRRGIERLGAKLDGILRSNAIQKNGTIRDTAVYTIISSEWSSVKANLEYQLVKNR